MEFESIQDYHKKLKNGQTSCTEAVRFYLNQIKQHQDLNAWLEVFTNEALERALLLDTEHNNLKELRPLHGVVIGIKDVISFQNHKVSAASKMLENYISIYNSTVVERLLKAGAIIIGRQNCDEFAMGSSNENSAFGPVKNGLDNSRVPGGSSGGSAVAIQTKTCMISLGSDTGGSVRQPADFCAVIGYKPSYGTISRHGLIAYASSFDQIGIFGNTIDDISKVLTIISGPDEFDSTMNQNNSIKKPLKKSQNKIAYFKQALDHEGLDSNIREQFFSFINSLTNQGFEVQPIDFKLFNYIVPTYYVLTTAEASSNLSRYDGVKYGFKTSCEFDDLTDFYKKTRSEGFGAEVKRRILLGTFVLSAGYYDAYFSKAQQVRAKLIKETQEIFSQFDALIMPTVPSPAFKIGEGPTNPIEMFLADIYTVYANLTGIPAISIPLFNHICGLPFGLQVMAERNDDLILLCLSEELMRIKKDQN